VNIFGEESLKFLKQLFNFIIIFFIVIIINHDSFKLKFDNILNSHFYLTQIIY